MYEAVLRVEKACIKMCKPGIVLGTIHEKSHKLLTEEVRKLGIQCNAKEMERIYPHSIGHWLGLDVHDCELVPGWTPLVPGVVVTIEPGLYFPPDMSCVPDRFKGIGVRIEDDILITSTGHEVLSADVPKEVEDIEALCAATAGSTPTAQ